ncbi:MAG: methenyltetrahydrofolate cyclohydrolase [candidate division Zixibacteria bacterium SM23_81]|nr:MAG: methenyltetrahydrofolate cyclohydrolase [candidate division Zixibacteria bacterium SM23_81]
MLTELKIDQFLQELASSSPAPGGGSVAALSGCLGAALVAMVCRLTVDKPKYAEVSEELRGILSEAEQLRQRLEGLVERDTEAFNSVMAAFRLPKETEEQRSERSSAIQEATRRATEVPLEVLSVSARVLELSQVVAAKGNVNSVSDAGVAAEMARAGARGAALNVQINLGGLQDESFVTDTRESMSAITNRIITLYSSVIKMVDDKLT